MKSKTMMTLIMTMIELTFADSLVPRIRIAVKIANIKTAGILIMPCTPSNDAWKGEWQNS